MSASVLSSGQGITSAVLSADVTNVGSPPPSNYGGTWAVSQFKGGCDGASISTGGIVSITEPGVYDLTFQLQSLLPADVESTNGVGSVLYNFAGAGLTLTGPVRASGYAQMPSSAGTGAGEPQELIISGGGLLVVTGVSSSSPGTLTPQLGWPTGVSSHGGAGVFPINKDATFINIKRIA